MGDFKKRGMGGDPNYRGYCCKHLYQFYNNFTFTTTWCKVYDYDGILTSFIKRDNLVKTFVFSSSNKTSIQHTQSYPFDEYDCMCIC